MTKSINQGVVVSGLFLRKRWCHLWTGPAGQKNFLFPLNKRGLNLAFKQNWSAYGLVGKRDVRYALHGFFASVAVQLKTNTSIFGGQYEMSLTYTTFFGGQSERNGKRERERERERVCVCASILQSTRVHESNLYEANGMWKPGKKLKKVKKLKKNFKRTPTISWDRVPTARDLKRNSPSISDRLMPCIIWKSKTLTSTLWTLDGVTK